MIVQSHQLAIVKALDGTNTVDKIKADTLESLINGELNAANGDKKIEDKKQLETVANALVDNTLEDFRKNFIFIA
jgi:methyltransferase-like protein